MNWRREWVVFANWYILQPDRFKQWQTLVDKAGYSQDDAFERVKYN